MTTEARQWFMIAAGACALLCCLFVAGAVMVELFYRAANRRPGKPSCSPPPDLSAKLTFLLRAHHARQS